MYLALYRKWRPKNFSDVIGQEHMLTSLQVFAELVKQHALKY